MNKTCCVPSFLLEDTAKVERPATRARQTPFTLVRLLLSWDYFARYSEGLHGYSIRVKSGVRAHELLGFVHPHTRRHYRRYRGSFRCRQVTKSCLIQQSQSLVASNKLLHPGISPLSEFSLKPFFNLANFIH